MTDDKKQNTEKLYSEEISLLPERDAEEYIRLNLRKIRSNRRQYDIPVIGIAGSEGKTTTKRMLTAILAQRFNILETPPDCSSTSGVTSTLLNLRESHQLAILELGIVDPKQFQWAVEVAEPNIGVITNIGEAHLASNGDKYLIADAKIELIRNLPEDGCAVLNIDDDLVSAMGRHATTHKIIKFGLNKNAHFYANQIEYLGPDGISFQVNGFYPFHMPIYSSASIYNALTAISVARVLGVEFDEIQDALQNRFRVMEHRGNLVRKKDVNILDHTYDATVNSATKACESLCQFKPFSKKVILVIGDLSNPGPKVKEAHLKMGYYIAALPIDTVVSVGEKAAWIVDGIKRMNKNKKTLVRCKTPGDLPELLAAHLEPQSTMLMIGSKELQLSHYLDTLLSQL